MLGLGNYSDSDDDHSNPTATFNTSSSTSVVIEKPLRHTSSKHKLTSLIGYGSEGEEGSDDTADADVEMHEDEDDDVDFNDSRDVSDMKSETYTKEFIAASFLSLVALELVPPEATSAVDPVVQGNIRGFLAKQKQGTYFNASVQGMKEFHNPSIMDLISRRFDVDQKGTNFPTYAYNPSDIGGVGTDDDFRVIARRQSRMEQREEERRKRRKVVDFVPANPKLTSSASHEMALGAKRPGSKWDAAK